MSKPATHGPGVCNQAARLSKLSCASTRVNRTTPPLAFPSATVIGLRRVGRLVTSTPATAWKSGEARFIVGATVRGPDSTENIDGRRQLQRRCCSQGRAPAAAGTHGDDRAQTQ